MSTIHYAGTAFEVPQQVAQSLTEFANHHAQDAAWFVVQSGGETIRLLIGPGISVAIADPATAVAASPVATSPVAVRSGGELLPEAF